MVILAASASAAYVPVFGGGEYNSSTNTGYQDINFGGLPVEPRPVAVANNAGLAVGTASKSGPSSGGNRALRWSSSGAPAVEMSTPARFGSIQTISWAYAINDAGFSVGAVYNDPFGERPVRWDSSGAVIELGILGTRGPGPSGDFTWGQAYDINNAGVTVGYTDSWRQGSYTDRAVRWSATGAVTPLGDISSGILDPPRTRAYAVNESSTAVGYSQVLLNGFMDGGTRAVRWEGTGTAATELGNLGLVSGRTRSEAYDVNENGASVGFANIGGIQGIPQAVRWDAGSTAATQLDSLGGSGPSRAYAINDAGTAVGFAPKSVPALANRAVLWNAGGSTATELAHIGVEAAGVAFDINNNGIVVGRDAGRAVAWRTPLVAIDLNSLIDPASGWTLNTADNITDTGWITGSGLFDPDGPGGLAAYNRSFLLQLPQVPEPVTAVFVLFAATIPFAARPKRP